jgi:hypothetical protein
LIPQSFKFCSSFLVKGFLSFPYKTFLLRSGIIESNPLLIIVWNKDVFSLHEWPVLSKVGMSTISIYFLTAKRELGLKSLTFTDAMLLMFLELVIV